MIATAYASGLVPMRDGVTLEDYRNAWGFRVGGIPRPEKWVDELRMQADELSMRSVE